jgi:hypothetical protein
VCRVISGREYKKAASELERHGVQVTLTTKATPQHNAICERMNRSLLLMVLSSLHHASMDPRLFWREALETAAYTRNRTHVHNIVRTHTNADGKETQGTAKLSLTSHELFTGERPNLAHMRVFGCDAIIHLPKGERENKLALHGEKAVFLGYDPRYPYAYRVRTEAGKIIHTRDVHFRETEFSIARSISTKFRLAQEAPGPSVADVGLASSSARPAAPPPASKHIEWRVLPSGELHYTAATSTSDTSDGEEDNTSVANEAAASSESTTLVDRPTMRQIEKLEKGQRRQAPKSQEERRRAKKGNAGLSARAPPRRSTRTRTQAKHDGLNPDDFGPGELALSVEAKPSNPLPAAPASAACPQGLRELDVKLPRSYQEVLRSPYAATWRVAMEEEMASMRANSVYELVPRPRHTNVVSCKWVFDVKSKDGFVVRFKARLVARGFSQREGVDYHADGTFAPVLKQKSLRLLLTYIALHDLEFELMDVMTAYLNAKLVEEVYMEQPEGYAEAEAAGQGQGQGRPRAATHDMVWRLLKAIYGLKQAGKEWYAHLHKFITEELGFTPLIADCCVYIRRSRLGNLIFLSVYVDDIPSAFHAADRAEWEEVKAAFFARFAIKFLGATDWFLNLRIRRDRAARTLYLDQQAYTETLLSELEAEGVLAGCPAGAAKHPGAPGGELSASDSPPDGAQGDAARERMRARKKHYPRVVGSLLYLANTTRPDIAHAVNVVPHAHRRNRRVCSSAPYSPLHPPGAWHCPMSGTARPRRPSQR